MKWEAVKPVEIVHGCYMAGIRNNADIYYWVVRHWTNDGWELISANSHSDCFRAVKAVINCLESIGDYESMILAKKLSNEFI